MAEAPGGKPDVGGLDATTKVCPGCGGTFTGDTHKECVTPGGTVKQRTPSSKSRLDDIPAEALPYDTDPARQLNQYLLVKQIGKGGMGTVWKAWDRKLTRWVAIKFLLASEEDDIARFQREAKLAARLRHPNIAPIYEVGEEPARLAGQTSRHYLAMEFIDGQSMAAALNLPLNSLLEIFLKVAQGVEAAHKAGVVHRDLKPQNIMLTTDGWPYVMDFGLAKALQTESSISVSGAVMGTPAYMPPEQARGELDQIDPQSDVYSLGATIYAVLCRKQPFSGQNPMEILMKACNEQPTSPRSLNAAIPEEVEAIILKAMSKDKRDRYPSAAAMAEDLRRFLSHEEVQARGPSSLQIAARKVRRNPWPLVLAAVLAAGAVAGVVFWPKKPAPPAPAPVAAPPSDLEAARIAEWKREWREQRNKLLFAGYKGDEPGLAAAINERLKGLKDLPVVEINEVKDWFQGELSDARRDVGEWASRPAAEWLKHRDEAVRVVRWCEVLGQALQGISELAKASDDAEAVRALALPISAYKGTFTLRVYVRDARVGAIRKAGTSVPVPGDPATPYVTLLDVDDYEVDVAHAGGSSTVSLKGVVPGKVYTVVGPPSALRVVAP
jgi:predicted Ser/Thr protein kinase